MTDVMPLTGCTEQFLDLQTRDTEIPYGRFNYPCRFKLNPAAQYLSVQLHGNVRRNIAVLPVFARWNWGNVLGAHVLSICDPTIYLDDTLRLGWYQGVEEENASHGVVAIARRCAEDLGISPERIVFSGSSAGGFAALQAAALMKNGKAIAINAQTDLLQFDQKTVRMYVDLVTPYASIEAAKNAFGNRWNAIAALRSAYERGYAPQIVMVNNFNDEHYQQHYLPFAEVFGLNLHEKQSVSGGFMSILYDGPHAHLPEPSEVVKRINNEGVPFLLGGKIDNIIPDFSTHITLESGKIQAKVETSDDNLHLFACHLYKNNVVIEKSMYSSQNKFIFDYHGPGKYMCRGFVRNKENGIFFKFSEIIQINA